MARVVANRVVDPVRLRVISGAILVAVALGITYYGGWPFIGLVLVTALLAVREWDVLCKGTGNDTVTLAQALTVAGAIFMAGNNALGDAIELMSAGALLVAVVALINRRRVFWPMAGVIYVSAPAIACIYLRGNVEIGLALMTWLFLVVWVCDMAAYFAGRALGGPKLAPRISPQKTWAGAVGGLLGAVVVGVTVSACFGDLAPTVVYGLLSVAVAIVVQLGDLAESWIKRHFKTKHSGRLIPGHGGILDRIDGLVFAAPMVAGLAILTQERWIIWQ